MEKIEQIKELNPNLAYIIGVMLGDGFCYHSIKGRSYMTSLKCIDKDFILKFQNVVEQEFKKKSHIFKEKSKFCKLGYCYRIRFCSKEMFYTIKFYKLEILKKLDNYSKQIQISFLDGLFDSEGYVSDPKHHKRLGIAMNNKEIIELCKNIFSNNLIDSHIYTSIKRDKPYYDLYICGRKNLFLCQQILSPSIKRKQDRIDNLLKSYVYS